MSKRDFYTVDQVAEILGVHHQTVRTWIRNGQLKAITVGRLLRISAKDFETYIKEGRI